MNYLQFIQLSNIFNILLKGVNFTYQLTTNQWFLHYNHILTSTFLDNSDIYIDFILQFTGDIWHVSGTDNYVVDALSQIEISILH